MYKVIQGRFCLSLFFVFFFTLYSSMSRAESDQLSKAFKSSTTDNPFQNKNDGTYYLALEAENIQPNVGNNGCVEANFFSWFKSFFSESNASISLIAEISDSGPNTYKVPLFHASKNESTRTCLYDAIASNSLITPYYPIDSQRNFSLNVQFASSKEAKVTAAETVVGVAKPLLNLFNGSGSLIQAATGPQLAAAVAKVDNTLAANWTMKNSENYRFDIPAKPRNGQWSNFKNQFDFSASNITSQYAGVTLSNRTPAIRIKAIYKESLFGDGPGKYINADAIMNSRVGSGGGNNLKDIFSSGVDGITTEKALAINDPDGLGLFCDQLRSRLAKYFTEDDALAARYAILKNATNYFRFLKLQNDSNCLTDEAKKRLLVLSPGFTLNTDSLERTNFEKRDKYVDARIKSLTATITNPETSSLKQILLNESTFKVDIMEEALKKGFPSTAEPGTKVGQKAIDAIVSSGGFRIGCAKTLRDQSISNLVAVALNKKTGESTSLFVEFSNSDPTPGADLIDEEIKIKRLSFYDHEDAKRFVDSTWPSKSCPLL